MAQQKKSFKSNPAMQFISAAEEEREAPQQEAAPQIGQAEGLNIPKGYRLAPEFKSDRMQLLVKPATKEAIRQAAAAQGLSMNELINRILDEYAERQGK